MTTRGPERPLRFRTLVAGCAVAAAIGFVGALATGRFALAAAPTSTASQEAFIASAGRIAGSPDPAAAGPCSLASRPSGALDTVGLFMATAVARRSTGLSYELATPHLRQGLSCSQWRSGRIPIVPMQSIDWSRGLAYRLLSRSENKLSLLLLVRSHLQVWGTRAYTVETVKSNGNWYVSYLMTAGLAAARD